MMEQVEQLNVLSLKKLYKIQQVNNLFHVLICLVFVNDSLVTSLLFHYHRENKDC